MRYALALWDTIVLFVDVYSNDIIIIVDCFEWPNAVLRLVIAFRPKSFVKSVVTYSSKK